MRESVLQRRCLEYVAKNFHGKLLAVNIHGGGFSNKGFPDLLVFGCGRAIAVELKANSGYGVQPDQLIWRKRFEDVGIRHYVINDLERFKSTIKEEFYEAQA